MRPRTRWWVEGTLPGLLTAGFGVLWLATGEVAAACVSFGWAGFIVIARQDARRWFARGWHAGFVEGLVLGPDASDGKLPSALLREVSTGDPAPNPWDAVPSHVRLTGGPGEGEPGGRED